MTLQQANQKFKTQHGQSIAEISAGRSVLLLFLRHQGCTFCREALADLAKQRKKIEDAGVKIALVHMSQPEDAQALFTRYDLGDVDAISDPGRELYQAYELQRGKLSQILGPYVFLRGFITTMLKFHLGGKIVGDVFQLPGAFLVRDSKIIKAYRHRTAADRPEYCELATGK